MAPSSPDPRAPGVAHFRRHWFGRTETFLHTTITHLRRTRPLLVGCERANAAEFPVTAPVLELQPPGSLAARVQEWRARWTGSDLYGRFDTRRTRRALARHGTRLLHAHFGYTGHQVLPLKRRSGLPLVTSFYGEDASRLPREPLWRERYAELFETGERFLVEGPRMRARLAELGCPPHKISIQHIAIPVARYPFRERAPRVAGECVRLLFCASLREKKGVLDALAATARARAEHPALELVLAGDGPLRGEVEAAVERLGLGAGVRRLGFVSHARMLEEMDAADLFIQPSVTARDGDTEGGAPTTLLEAQACGLPVLATRHADIPHVVREGESALLSPEGDVERLAANLLELLKQPERWAALGRAGRRHVERCHAAEVETARLEELQLALCAGGDA